MHVPTKDAPGNSTLIQTIHPGLPESLDQKIFNLLTLLCKCCNVDYGCVYITINSHEHVICRGFNQDGFLQQRGFQKIKSAAYRDNLDDTILEIDNTLISYVIKELVVENG